MTAQAAQLHGPSGSGLLEGKVVVITAAAGTGIGGACARRCLAEGAQVFISDIHKGRLEHTAEDLGVASMLCDVTHSGAIDELLNAAEDAYGPVDVLVNNAGLGGNARITDLNDSDWDRVLAVTLTSAAADGPARTRQRRQHRLHHRMARRARPVPLRRGQGRRHGADPQRRR